MKAIRLFPFLLLLSLTTIAQAPDSSYVLPDSLDGTPIIHDSAVAVWVSSHDTFAPFPARLTLPVQRRKAAKKQEEVSISYSTADSNFTHYEFYVYQVRPPSGKPRLVGPPPPPPPPSQYEFYSSLAQAFALLSIAFGLLGAGLAIASIILRRTNNP